MGQEIDIEAVRKRFREANMPGALKLLDFLLTDRGKQLLFLEGELWTEEGDWAAHVVIGATVQEPHTTPLDDLARLSLELPNLSEENREKLVLLDAFMAGYASNPDAKTRQKLEINSSLN